MRKSLVTRGRARNMARMVSNSDLDLDFPAVSDLRRKARARIPHFAFEYLDSGTGDELQVARNRAALDAVQFLPDILCGPMAPDFTTSLLGREYGRPFGIAPVGMSGLMWPGAERILAAAAARNRIPYGLSTVATKLPEEVGPVAGDMGWFQLYAPDDTEILKDILERARASGFTTLVLTVDVPDDSRRERQRRAKLSLPPKIDARMVWEIATHPRWSLGTLREGRPRLKLAEGYLKDTGSRSSTAHAGHVIRGRPGWDYIETLRGLWDGHLIIKGVMDPDHAVRLVGMGADAIWVSNHSGRQFEGGPASITQLPKVRAALGPDTPIVFDSGVATGMDILRARALGADFVMLGRAWHYAVAALGAAGPDHLIHILTDDMKLNMAQIGAKDLSDLSRRLMR
ncbi:MAG: alpha-hydroxy acid oxidase [Pseudomonadota bacterium]